jgi:hypothetical protein
MKVIIARSRVMAFLFISFVAVAILRAESPTDFVVGGFTFVRPTSWEWMPVSSPMRKAQLKVADSTSKPSAGVVFFLFPHGSSGGVKANVDRWLRQFSGSRESLGAKIEETTIGKIKVTYVQAEGTFNSGMPGGALTPMPDYGLMGAILESDNGDVFVKMTGPKNLVKSSVADFKKMVAAAAKKD